MTVDSHVHLLPRRLGEAIRAYFADHGYGPETWRYPLDHAALAEQLAAEGVESAWSLPYARRPGTAAGLNESSAALLASPAASSLELVGGATVHPGDDDPAGVVRHAVEGLGLRVLKLHCSVGDFSPDDRRLDPVWSWVSDVRLPVVVHAGHAVSGHTAAAELTPLGTVAARWPEARVVIAHCGHRAVDEALDLIEAHRSVHADLTPVVREPVALPTGRIAPLAPKLLFGSDCPNTAVTVTESLASLDAHGLDATVLAAIRGGNARRLQAEVRI